MKRWARSLIAMTVIGIFALLLTRFDWKNMASSPVEQLAYVNVSNALNVRSGAGTSNGQLTDTEGNLISLTPGTIVTIIGSATASNGATWYQIRFNYGEQTDLIGYVYGPYLVTFELEEDPEFDAYLAEQGFPESYYQGLALLHSQHPEWTFVAQQTGLEWADVIAAESKTGMNLAYYSCITSWKYAADGTFDWETNTWVRKDGSDTYPWHAASTEIVQYFMDPRNFLTERGVFMFQQNSYDPALHTLEGVQSRLDGTFMAGEIPDENITYAQAFMDAAVASGVSPYVLVARVIQEMGSGGTSRIISGTVPGYEKLYNYFDIGAYLTSENDVITNGLIYASKTNEKYLLPWNTRYRSLVGGSIWLGSTYIAVGQDTLYLQKFNVQGTKPYTHQYMTNIQAASNEASTMYSTYTNLEQEFIFKIPVFNNMPSAKCPRPTKDGNPNPYLSTIAVEGQALTPTYDFKTLEYDIVVPSTVDSINITATPFASTTTVTNTGKKTLVYGDNTIKLVCTAEYGNTVTYVLKVYRDETDEVLTTDYTITGNIISGVSPNTSGEAFLKKIAVTNSTISEVLDASGNPITTGLVTNGSTYKTEDQSFTIRIMGDVNGDGQITIVDLLYTKRHILGIAKLSGISLTVADVNGDGQITIVDMLYIKRHILGTMTITQ